MPPLQKTVLAFLYKLTALAAVIAIITAAFFFSPSPSPEERVAFEHWEASQAHQGSRGSVQNKGGDE